MTITSEDRAELIIARCREIAQCTQVPGETTRLFLSPPMREVHALLRTWMEAAGMAVRVDAAGNLRGVYAGVDRAARRLVIGSHLDTVPNAGAFDGVLGVMLGLAIVEELHGERLPFSVEVIGFSEEEGIRFGKPFLGSLALLGRLDVETLSRTDQDGVSISAAMAAFGLGGLSLEDAVIDQNTRAFVEFHIEQGPVLEDEGHALGIVDAIAGQTRLQLVFTGQANHAGTTPMRLRHDAMAATAHWIVEVEQYALAHDGLVATVGRVDPKPGAVNVIPGEVVATLDVRHADDQMRHTAVAAMLSHAEFAAGSRGVRVATTRLHEQAAVLMDPQLVATLVQSAARAGFPTHTLTSGAGHDAMIVAERVPAVMLFLRSPGGLSHHPEEAVLSHDVAAALATAMEFLKLLGDRAGRLSSVDKDTDA